MPSIPQETIDKVLDSTDIVELIGSYVSLKRVGQNFQGLCPFHSEKTPSFVVTGEKKIFRCFGCKISGNAITFIKKHQNLPFPEAVRVLAEKAGLSMETEEDKKRETLLFCVAKAQEEFRDELRAGSYRLPQDYLKGRGISPNTQEEFGLGFAGSVKDLIASLKKWGIKEKEIPLSIGILKEKEKGLTCPFMGRITLPIFDPRGNIVGFGGRATDNSQQAKYVNSSDSSVFSKRRCLFGLNRVKPISETVLVVEGYFDVLSLHQAGFSNTVGLLGTELSLEQVKILERLAHNVTFLFDSDGGGNAALLKCLKIPLQNINARAVLLPEGDPDEFIRKGKQDELQALVEKAKGVREASVEIIAQRAKGEKVENIVEETARIAAQIPDGVEASLFVEMAAQALNLPAWALQEKTQAKREKKEKIVERKRELERLVVELLLANPSLKGHKTLQSIEELFEEGRERKILQDFIKQGDAEAGKKATLP
jgi:DNA primase